MLQFSSTVLSAPSPYQNFVHLRTFDINFPSRQRSDVSPL